MGVRAKQPVDLSADLEDKPKDYGDTETLFQQIEKAHNKPEAVPAKPKTPPDPELQAIKRIMGILESMSEDASARVMSYVRARVIERMIQKNPGLDFDPVG